MPSKKLSSRTSAYFGGIALLIFLAAVGLASGLYLHGRLDLTRDRQFTLSRAALRALKELPDIVTVKVIMSRDLPVQFQQRRREVVDLLGEFEARSNGKLKVLFEDPGEDEAKRQAAAELGVKEVALQQESREGDLQVKKGYFGLAMLYGDKKEVVPMLQGLGTLEYDLVVKMKRLTGKMKVIGVAEGRFENRFTVVLPGEGRPTTVGFEQNFPTLKGAMENLFEVRQQDLVAGAIDSSVDLLIVAAPLFLQDVEKYRIDQFLMSGRPVIFLTPGMNVHMTEGLTGDPSNNGYEDLLAYYGVGVAKNVLLEPRFSEEIRFGDATYQTPYPYWMAENYTTFNSGSPITARLQTLSFPWASSLDLNPKAQDSARQEVLVRTTDEAWEETGEVLMNPQDVSGYLPVNQKSFPLAVLQTGKLKSFYADALPAGISARDSAGTLRASRGEAKFLVIGNALFATDFYVNYTGAGGNIHLLLNALDQLALDPDLITIRSRLIREAPLDEDAVARLKTPVLLINMLLAPALLLAIGIFAGVRRRKREARA